MSALRKQSPQTSTETEVIYLVLPPVESAALSTPISAPRPYNFVELACLGWVSFREGVVAKFFSRAADSALLLGACLIIAPLSLYGMYILKSAAGIDLFPKEHLESFVPVKGWMRW